MGISGGDGMGISGGKKQLSINCGIWTAHTRWSVLCCPVSELSQLQISDTLRFKPPFGGVGATYDVHQSKAHSGLHIGVN